MHTKGKTVSDLNQLVEDLSKLTVLEMSELKKLLEDKWGVQAQAAAVAVAAPAEGGAASEAEATEFNIILKAVPADKKIAAIKAMREVLSLGLKEAKEFVTDVPKTVKESAPKAEAEEIAKKLRDAGAEVELNPA